MSVLAALSPPALAQPTTGRILVSLHDVRTAPAVLAAAGAEPGGQQVPQIGLVTARPRLGVARQKALVALRRDQRVRAASEEGRFQLRFTPDDPALHVREPDHDAPRGSPLQWAVERQGLLRAWDITRGEGARVAIVDTGVEARHPDLAGKIAMTLDLDGGAPGGAGEDLDGHGTHVASLACAATGNGIGIAGAGHDCSIMAIKTDLTDFSVAASIVAATDRGAHAINMSFGDDGSARSQAVADAVEYATGQGVVLVAAAADQPVEEQGEPANLLQRPGTGEDIGAGRGLVITAADSTDERAVFAGRGSGVSMAAYGALRSGKRVRGLFGAYPKELTEREVMTACGCRTSFDGDERWAYLSGTSMAAPQVAAVSAMIKRMNPELSALEVVQILKETARRAPGQSWEADLGWGILNAGAAVERARGIDRRSPVSVLQVRRRRSVATISWQSLDSGRQGMQPSGVVHVEIWVARDGRPARRLTRRGAVGTVRMRVRRRHRYEFHSVAVDRAGNREDVPARPDATVRL